MYMYMYMYICICICICTCTCTYKPESALLRSRRRILGAFTAARASGGLRESLVRCCLGLEALTLRLPQLQLERLQLTSKPSFENPSLF